MINLFSSIQAFHFNFYAVASITINTLFINGYLFFTVKELKKTF